MKRIYLLMSALLAGMCTTTTINAQSVDLRADLGIDSGACLRLGSYFTPRTGSAIGDSITGAYGIFNDGPDPVLSGDKVWFATPFNTFTEDGLYFTPVTIDADKNSGDLVLGYSYDMIDSIKCLVNLENVSTAETYAELLVHREDFDNGAEYGFFLFIGGIGEDLNNVDTTLDPNKRNDATIVRVKWNDCATSIEDMIVGKEKVALVTYPNPASDNMSFDYTFDKTTAMATARVADITGRTVLLKEFGRQIQGRQTFTLDISSLNPGMYMVEFSTDDRRAVSKFSVK